MTIVEIQIETRKLVKRMARDPRQQEAREEVKLVLRAINRAVARIKSSGAELEPYPFE